MPSNKPQILLRISPELRDRLKEAAKERTVSMSWLAERAIQEFLDNLLPPEEIKWTRNSVALAYVCTCGHLKDRHFDISEPADTGMIGCSDCTCRGYRDENRQTRPTTSMLPVNQRMCQCGHVRQNHDGVLEGTTCDICACSKFVRMV